MNLFPLVASAADINLVQNNITLRPYSEVRTMLNGRNVSFWFYSTTPSRTGELSASDDPLVFGVDDSVTLTLTNDNQGNVNNNNNPASPNELDYPGHSLYFHGLSLSQNSFPLSPVLAGNTTIYALTSNQPGSHIYYCHTHKVKHMEMGEYGTLIVRPKNALNVIIPQLNNNPETAFEHEWVLVFSSVDSRYHGSGLSVLGPIDDSPVFAGYNPDYYLINSNEGPSISQTASTFIANTNNANEKLAIRLIGAQAVDVLFEINDITQTPQTFDIYNIDGMELTNDTGQPTPRLNQTSVIIAPGQTYDIIVTLPNVASIWYPQAQFINPNTASSTTVFAQLLVN